MFYLNNEIESDIRFDAIKFIDFEKDNVDPMDSFMIENLLSLPSIGSYNIVSEEFRPDLISYNIYEDTQYWWLLMLYNKILDISDLKSGTDILYPNKNSIEAIYQQAALLEKVK